MTSRNLIGSYFRDEEFDVQMEQLFDKRAYEAPTVFRTVDNNLWLMMDYYGCKRKENQGYVPFMIESLEKPKLNMAKEKFQFPYGFKHGAILGIT